MTEINLAAALPAWDVTIVEPAAAAGADLPEPWRPIATSTDPRERLETAVALWNEPLLEAVPQFADALRTRFVDVRAGHTAGDAVLVYVASVAGDDHVAWVGYDPRGFGDPPPFWDRFPTALREFLQGVHAGFVSGTPTTYGPMRPRHMETLASLAGEPDGLPDWDDEQEIASTRLLRIASDGGLMHYCVSPDVEVGELAVVYEGDIDPEDYGRQLDRLMMLRFRR